MTVVIEPWADEIVVPAGESWMLILKGTAPTGAPHAQFEWHGWGLLVWAEIGMVERRVVAQDGSLMLQTSRNLAGLLSKAERVTFPAVWSRRPRWWSLTRRGRG